MSSSVLKLSSKEPVTSSCFLKDQQSIKCLSLKSGTGFIPLLVVIYLHPRHLIQTKCPGTSELRTIFWGFISICRFEMLDFVFQKKEIKTRKLRTLICIINTRVCEPGSGRCVSSPSQN